MNSGTLTNYNSIPVFLKNARDLFDQSDVQMNILKNDKKRGGKITRKRSNHNNRKSRRYIKRR